MWPLVLRALLFVVRHPAVQAWARAKAHTLAERVKSSHYTQINTLYAAVGMEPPVVAPQVKASRLIKMRTDVLRPGNTVVVDGDVYKVTRLISASAVEVIYEATRV